MVCSERVWAVWIRGEQVFVLREADADRGEMSLVRWTIGEPSAHIMWRGPDLLFGCTIAGTGLLCVRESATKAPSIQRVDLVTGGAHTILDLNPELSPERLGSVTRLSWRDATGTLAFGDFALPAMRRPGEKLPLIVVQYESRGFLRGGTGDEYPIHALAQAGQPPREVRLVGEGASCGRVREAVRLAERKDGVLQLPPLQQFRGWHAEVADRKLAQSRG